MPLETANYISDLVTSNPAASDGMNNADDHMRLIKAVLKATFPNFTSAALDSSQAELDAVAALLVNGVLRANGACAPGMVADFAMATAPTGWLECDGSAVSRTTYADLFDKIGTTWGAGNGSTTFNLPPDRYRVGRTTAGAAVGTLQASQNKAHTHAFAGALTAGTLATASDGNHYHAASIYDPTHAHSISNIGIAGTGGIGYGGSPYIAGQIGSANTNGAATGVRVNSSNGLDTTYSAGAHTHTISGAPSIGTLATVSDGGTEGRPLSATYLTCIKT
jgi:microcystin-dependent protein